MRHFSVLACMLVVVLATSASGEDVSPAPWRGEPGTTFSMWTYDEDAPGDPVFPRLDAPEESWFVPHPDKADPDSFQEVYEEEWAADFPGLNFEDIFSLQLWAEEPAWQGEFRGRTGVLTDFVAGSWDIQNFWHDQPLKELRMQVTWQPMLAPPEELAYELEWAFEGLITEDWMETPEAEWDYDAWGEPEEFWEEDGTQWAGGDVTLPEDEWFVGEVWEFVEGVLDPEIVVLDDQWLHATIDLAMEPNPFVEFLGIFPDVPVAIDEVIIETICVPEPATMLLLGLGGLALVRRRKR